MNQKELYRVEIIQNLIEKQLVETQAAVQLGLSLRQIRRFKQAYLTDGTKGLVTKKGGKPSNRKYPVAVKEVALMYVQEHYHDFRPTFASFQRDLTSMDD